MKVLVRAVISGFGFSLGAALYKRVSKHLGLDETPRTDSPDPATATPANGDDGGEAGDPGAAQLAH